MRTIDKIISREAVRKVKQMGYAVKSSDNYLRAIKNFKRKDGSDYHSTIMAYLHNNNFITVKEYVIKDGSPINNPKRNKKDKVVKTNDYSLAREYFLSLAALYN